MLESVSHQSITFTSPVALWVGVAICATTVLVTLLRRPAVSTVTKALILLGMVLLCLAAGGPIWRRPAGGEVAVMVDLSPSTRSAEYRKRAVLESRVRQLLGGAPFRMYYFADGMGPAGLAGTADLPDLPAERTRYEPPAGAAVLVFSDGRFPLPAPGAGGPPTRCV